MTAEQPVPDAPPRKRFKFPTAFTVLAARPAPRLDRVVLRPRRRLQDRPGDRRARARHLPRAAVVLGAGGDGAGARRRLADRERPGAGRRRVRARRDDHCGEAGQPCVDTSFTFRFKQLWNAPPNGLYGVEAANGFVGPVGGGLPLRLGRDLPLRARRRRVHHRHDEDRGDPDRHRPARAALPAQRLRADRDPDDGLRARRHELRDVGGDARLLRAARAARARARLRPDGRGGDHLPRRRQRA